MKKSLVFFIAFLVLQFPRSDAVTLDTVLAETLRRNPHILETKSGLEIAAGQRILLRSVAYPKGLLGAVAGDQGGQRSRNSGNQPFILAYGVFSQALFGEGIPAAFRRGDVAVLAAQQQLNVTVANELHNARLAFYQALYNRSLESLGKVQREQLEKNVASEQARYEAGQGDRGAITAATLLARELDPRIEDARGRYDAAILQLAQSMGRSLGAGVPLPLPEGTLDFENAERRWQTEVESALRDRADLKLARLLVRAAKEDQRLIAAQYYPAVDAIAAGEAIPVSGIYHDSGGSPQSTANTLANEVGAGVSYTWGVVDNGKVGAEVSEQRAVRETNELELRKLEASVPRELARIENDLRAISTRYQSLSATADVAEKNVKSVEENRAQGLASVLDFRTAENDLLVARRGVLSAIYEQKVALAEWDLATGRYFQFSDDTAAKVH
jgi:outer membrane protein TolC